MRKPQRDRSKEYRNRKRSPAYHSWNAAIQRCHNRRHRSFRDYGARGIEVCDHWRGSFENFLVDMGERPEGLTLDRNDYNGPYCKENCKWSDKPTQSANRRSKAEMSICNAAYVAEVDEWHRTVLESGMPNF